MIDNKIKIPIPKEWNDISVQDLFKLKWQAPKKLVHNLRMEKSVLLNGEVTLWTESLKTGDQLEISISEKDKKTIQPTYFSINILYEDDHLLVVNKPANMITHPNIDEKNTLLNAVIYYLNGSYASHIHRLDKNTTGTVLFAKHPLSHAILDRMLEERKIKRTYWALTDGLFHKKVGIINAPIGRDRHHSTRRRVSNTGQSAVTDYRVLSTFPKEQLTLIECTLRTGRTHQIRVHFQHIGHPLAGDKLYDGSSLFNRQALHARKITFIHPFSLKKLEIQAPFIDEPAIFDRFFKRND